jgi:hypothetical protein
MYNAELVEQIRPGMHLCSSDYKKWGEVDSVQRPPDDSPDDPIIAGHLENGGRLVYVPASAALEIRGGKCVRLDAPLSEVDGQGWEQAPAFLATEIS